MYSQRLHVYTYIPSVDERQVHLCSVLAYTYTDIDVLAARSNSPARDPSRFPRFTYLDLQAPMPAVGSYIFSLSIWLSGESYTRSPVVVASLVYKTKYTRLAWQCLALERASQVCSISFPLTTAAIYTRRFCSRSRETYKSRAKIYKQLNPLFRVDLRVQLPSALCFYILTKFCTLSDYLLNLERSRQAINLRRENSSPPAVTLICWQLSYWCTLV